MHIDIYLHFSEGFAAATPTTNRIRRGENHVLNRRDRKEDIVVNDAARELFVRTLGEACAKTDWQMYAYCLKQNYFHLAVAPPQPNLSAGMQWLLGTYTARFTMGHWRSAINVVRLARQASNQLCISDLFSPSFSPFSF
jgi:REP element-mobilizing transposase RayT